MASQFDRLMKTITSQQRDLMDIQVIVAENRKLLRMIIQNSIDEESLQLGLDEPVFSEAVERLENSGLIRTGGQGDPLPGEDTWTERVVEDESPRQRLPYKSQGGKEAFVEWNSLDEEMQKAVEFARIGDEPWQLYEGADGEIRIGISSQVANQLRAWKLGNQIGK